MSVVIIATLDTKGPEIQFARDVLEERGLDTHLVDVGVMDPPTIEPGTTRNVVADRAGTTIEALVDAGDRGSAMQRMGEGAAVVAEELHDSGELQAVFGLGGSGNTSVATRAMRAIPYGVPKVMLSTMASGDVQPYVQSRDIAMMYSVADIEGLNSITRRIIRNAALAVGGMVEDAATVEPGDKPVIGITMFGVTTPCVQRAREQLESRGYEVVVFHATGTGGRALENLIDQGAIDGVLDVTTTELADELVGGALSAGPNRLEAAGDRGIPQVVSVGALDMVNFGPSETIPNEFADRQFHQHNPEVTLMRTTPAENATLGHTLAEKLNRATGPTAVYLSREGISMLDAAGEPFHDEAADRQLFDAVRDHLTGPGLEECELHINDPAFAEAMANHLDELMGTVGSS